MGQKMLRFDLTELKVIRVRCKKCNKVVIEAPVDQLGLALDCGQCRFCGHPHIQPSRPNPVDQFKQALLDLSAMTNDLGIELELPNPPSAS